MPLLADGTAVEVMLPGTPLERYEVDELKLVGILWDVRAPKAMFVDPVGEVHVLSKDDRIGRRRGYVAVIREGEVVIVEASTFGGDNAFATRVLRIER
jgi:Tfp pilus assembly protein PilP